MSEQVAKDRLYRTADDRVVYEDDPDAAFLLANEGDEVPEGYKVPAKRRAAGADKKADAPANKSAKG